MTSTAGYGVLRGYWARIFCILRVLLSVQTKQTQPIKNGKAAALPYTHRPPARHLAAQARQVLRGHQPIRLRIVRQQFFPHVNGPRILPKQRLHKRRQA